MDIGSQRELDTEMGCLKGQRTKNNSRTRKGRKTVANKKKVTK